MAIPKNKKKEIVDDLTASISNAQSLVFVKFDKLKVADVNSFRRQLGSQDVGYTVAKKTLIKRALASKKIAGELPELPGQIGVAFGQDPLAAAREVYEFQKTHKDNISIVGGMFEESYADQARMMSIATIPPREVLYAQLANLINSPIQRLAIALDQIAGKKA